MPRLAFSVTAGDVETSGSASEEIASRVRALGIEEGLARRAGIVAFEGEMNLMLYAKSGGTVTVEILPEALEIVVEDNGPGIDDIELAMTPGFSTAPEWAIELGFGAGMGLVNMKNNSDHFEITSKPGDGTRIRCRIDRRTHAA